MDTDRSLVWAPSDTMPDGALSTIRICSRCGSAYDASARYCHRDGTRLGSDGGATVTVAPVYVVAAARSAPLPADTLVDAPSPFGAEDDGAPELAIAGLSHGAAWRMAALLAAVVAATIWIVASR